MDQELLQPVMDMTRILWTSVILKELGISSERVNLAGFIGRLQHPRNPSRQCVDFSVKLSS
jgi:hypothetical protein